MSGLEAAEDSHAAAGLSHLRNRPKIVPQMFAVSCTHRQVRPEKDSGHGLLVFAADTNTPFRVSERVKRGPFLLSLLACRSYGQVQTAPFLRRGISSEDKNNLDNPTRCRRFFRARFIFLRCLYVCGWGVTRGELLCAGRGRSDDETFQVAL